MNISLRPVNEKGYEYKFSPILSGKENSAALQKAADKGGEIRITEPGIYDIEDTVYLGSDTTLIFGEGVILRRQSSSPFNGNVFINKGAFTGKSDKNIKIKGLKLLVNGVEFTPPSEDWNKTIIGLRGHIAFLYIENLTLENIEITGLEKLAYGIQVCNFKNVLIDTVYIEGKKDGVHFGPGTDFVLRNGTFRTADDPIALNADDYAVSNPTLGVIANGLIENCTDLYEELNDGYFVRILSGAWVDWYSGMKIRHSDSVVYNGKLYRAVMTPSWDEYISINPPDFQEGFKTIDGIRWAKTGYEAVYNSYVRNITFKNIHLNKSREIGIAFAIEQNEYRRGLYDGATLINNGNFVFDGIIVSEDVKYPVAVKTPVDGIVIKNSSFANGKLLINNDNQAKIKCPPLKLKLDNNDFGIEDIICEEREII